MRTKPENSFMSLSMKKLIYFFIKSLKYFFKHEEKHEFVLLGSNFMIEPTMKRKFQSNIQHEIS